MTVVHFVESGPRSDRKQEPFGKDREAAQARKEELIKSGAKRVQLRSINTGACGSKPATVRLQISRLQVA